MDIIEEYILGERVYALTVSDGTVLYFRVRSNAQRVMDIINDDWISEVPEVDM